MIRCHLFPRACWSVCGVPAGRAVCWTVALALTAIGLVGCGSEGFELVPVSGTVTLDGQPLAGASVSFQPTGGGATPGPGSSAVTDASGKFQLKTSEATQRTGAVAGSHAVRISAAQDQRDASDDTQHPPAKDPVPAQYREGVPFTVPAGGTDKADFDLKSK